VVTRRICGSHICRKSPGIAEKKEKATAVKKGVGNDVNVFRRRRGRNDRISDENLVGLGGGGVDDGERSHVSVFLKFDARNDGGIVVDKGVLGDNSVADTPAMIREIRTNDNF